MIFHLIRDAFRNRSSQEWNIRGDNYWRKGDVANAERCFRAAIKMGTSSSAPALSNLGMLLLSAHRYDDGFAMLIRAAEIDRRHPGILVNLGNGYLRAGQMSKCVEVYKEALQIDPDNPFAITNLLRPLMEICDWNGVEELLTSIRGKITQSTENRPSRYITAFNSLFLPLSRKEQLSIAIDTGKSFANMAKPFFRQGSINLKRSRRNERIRVGYLSSDFHDHPTAHLTLGIYGAHDRDKFEIYCYSIGYPDESQYRKRIVGDCDKFVDVHSLGSKEIAKRIYDDQIDILVDLKGYTGGSRPEILAMRPAPIQVNYLGYPGTLGASFINYLVADSVVIPPSHAADYSEKIIRLPRSYQATDNMQPIAEAVERTTAGLPNSGFIYCCFNNSAKIDRRTFMAWMEILRQVPESILWLLDAPTDAKSNLQLAAIAAGIDPSRLIFAAILPKPLHLSRLRCADLALDTFICNSHTTATDSLWAGVPILTLMGDTFASRVASSLLHAAEVPALVVRQEVDFIETAISLAKNPERLAALKDELVASKMKSLFNTLQYVLDLEAAYEQMYRP